MPGMQPHPQGTSLRLAPRTWEGAGRPVLFVPVGSTEQHGPHLPLWTDTVVARAVGDDLAARCRAAGIEAAVAPALAYGASGEHQDFGGTISIGTAAVAFALLELGRSASAWAERIVFVNGHGGNIDALAESVPTLRSEGRDASWLPCAVPGGRDAHAGFDETSLMLHLRPDEVPSGRFDPGASAPMSELLPRLRAEGVRGVAPNGVLGDPTGATAADGARLFAAMCDAAWARIAQGRVTESGCLAPATPDLPPTEDPAP